MSFITSRKAQVSLEYIIIVGVMLLIVTGIIPIISKHGELNKAVAAVRDGATYGATLRGMGFKPEGDEDIPEGVIKISGVDLINKGKCGDRHCYMLKIHILAPDYIKSNSTYKSSLGSSIRTQALRQLYYAFNGEYPGSSVIGSVNTSYYSFTCGYSFD